LRPGQPAEFLEGAGPRWHIAAFEPAEGYAAAVVYDGAPVSVKFMGTI
jgi:hypothetical protein